MYTRIFIAVNNYEEVLTIPVMPDDFTFEEPEQNNEVYNGLSQDYSRIGTMGLRKLSWSSFFPDEQNKDFYKFADYGNGKYTGFLYVDFFQRWRKKKVPFRVVVLSDVFIGINMPCTIDSFRYRIKRNRDIAYTISLTEYRFVE